MPWVLRSKARNDGLPKGESEVTVNPMLVLAYFREMRLPDAVPEFAFAAHIGRKFKFDYAFVGGERLAIEVQGGLFRVRGKDGLLIPGGGRHCQGAALVKEYEKLTLAATLGWRVIYVQPRDLLTLATVETIRECLTWKVGKV